MPLIIFSKYTPLTVDPYFNYNGLLLKSTGSNANATFLDSSTNNATVSKSGTPTQGSFSPYANAYNAYIGAASGITVASNAVLSFGGNFTIEAFVKPLQAQDNNFIYGDGDAATNNGSVIFTLDVNNHLVFAAYISAAGLGTIITSTGTVPLGTWSHVAVSRVGTNIYFAINGVVQTLAGAGVSSYRGVGTNPTIGSMGAFYGVRTFLGHINDFHITNGTALYTANYTTPTAALKANGNTALLTCRSNRFKDVSVNNLALAPVGLANIQVGGPFTKHSITSNSFYSPGASDGFSSGSINLSNIDFTVEFWMYKTGTAGTNSYIISFGNGYTTTSSLCLMQLNNSYVISIQSNTTASLSTVVYNQWLHVALVRASGVITLYINGTSIGNGPAGSTTTFPSQALHTGVAGGLPTLANFNGYISNLRVVTGTAVYTSNFTPSTSPLTAISGTALLTCQSPTLIDNSGNGLALTSAGGTGQIALFNPLSDNIVANSVYLPANNGGSKYQSLKTDSLTVPATAAITTFTGDFTIEAWVYPTDVSLTVGWGIVDARTTASTATNWVFDLESYTSAGWLLNFYNGAAHYSATRVLPNQWTHVAVARVGTTLSFYINGVKDANTVTISGTLAGGTSTVALMSHKDSATAGAGNAGYCTDLRIVNGTAKYTATFLPPTTPLTAVSGTSLLLSCVNAGTNDVTQKNDLAMIGGTTTSTSVNKYKESIHFDGALGSYGRFAASPNFDFKTANFTIEMWLNIGAYNTNGTIFFRTSEAAGFAGIELKLSSAGILTTNMSSTGTSWDIASGLTYATALALNTWKHIAVVRNGTNISIYVNGVSVISITSSASIWYLAGSHYPNIGGLLGSTNYGLTGNIEDLRITNGVARYTGTFTPPAELITYG